MSTYAIGDVQGCLSALKCLLEKIHFTPNQDTLWLTGDLVNRGPQSLEVLRFIRNLGSSAFTVLGNHDIHLLSVFYKVRTLYADDTLTSILAAPDCTQLLEWLRHRPLLYHQRINQVDYVITHAGLAPAWHLSEAIALAKEVEAALQSEVPAYFLAHFYGNEPSRWNPHLTGTERLRCINNHFTRMRYCYADGRLALSYDGYSQEEKISPDLLPWFAIKQRANADVHLLFGHWSALMGNVNGILNVYALDTGCVWGKCLTAMRLEDKKFFSVNCDPKRALHP